MNTDHRRDDALCMHTKRDARWRSADHGFGLVASTLPLAVGASALISAGAARGVAHRVTLGTVGLVAACAGLALFAVRRRLPVGFVRVQVLPAVLAIGTATWACGPGAMQPVFASFFIVAAAHFAWWRPGRLTVAGVAATVGAYGLLLHAEGAQDGALQVGVLGTVLALIGGTFANLARTLGAANARDPLTGLTNRATWERSAQAVVASCARSEPSCVVVVIDLDGFKRTNDTHGHDAGDRMLIAAADAWSGALRRGDLLCRWGGDEFALLLPGTSLDAAEDVVARLRAAEPRLPFSYGAAVATGSVLDAVAEADARLLAAKRNRKPGASTAGGAAVTVAGSPHGRKTP